MSPVAVAAPVSRSRPTFRSAVAVLPAPRRAPAVRPSLRVVTPARQARLVRRSVVLAAIGTVAALLALVIVHVMLAQSQLTLDQLNRQGDAAQARYEQARLAHAQLAAPSRIVARAAQLGLVPPAQPAIPVPTGSFAPPPAAASSTSPTATP